MNMYLAVFGLQEIRGDPENGTLSYKTALDLGGV